MLGLLAGAVALGVRLRTRRELRRPTPAQLDDMAAPIGRIAARHANVAWLNKDLLDLVAAGSALGAYVNDGPLTTDPAPDPGVPDNLQESYA